TEEEWIQLQKEEQWAREHESEPQAPGTPDAHANPWFAAAESQVAPEPNVPDGMPAEPEPDAEAVTYLDVFQAYAAEYGTYPSTVKQFSDFLVGTYGVHVGERELEQRLGELNQEMADPLTDDQVAGEGEAAEGHGGGSSAEMTGPATGPAEHPQPGVQPQPVGQPPVAAERVPATTGAAGGRMAAGGVPHQMTAGTNGGAAGGSSAAAEPTVWEASVEATARVPEPRDQEEELDPVTQQIITVAGWIEEAEAAGEKLAGAEVARRLGLSPKSGQRRVIAAAEYLEEQRRQQGRTHLRSVQNQR
ncbi:hypothetical protein ACFC7A_19630, partial [Streptomyces niveus]